MDQRLVDERLLLRIQPDDRLGDFGIDAKALFITADEAENVEKSARNIQGVKAINTNGLNVFDILNSDKLFITKDAITRIEEVFA